MQIHAQRGGTEILNQHDIYDIALDVIKDFICWIGLQKVLYMFWLLMAKVELDNKQPAHKPWGLKWSSLKVFRNVICEIIS